MTAVDDGPAYTRAWCAPPCNAPLYLRSDRPGGWLHSDPTAAFFCPHDTAEPGPEPAVQQLTADDLIRELSRLPGHTPIKIHDLITGAELPALIVHATRAGFSLCGHADLPAPPPPDAAQAARPQRTPCLPH